MAVWPDLESLNGGQQFTAADAVTSQVFNAIVDSLKAMSAPAPVGNHYVTITSNYTDESSGIPIAAAYYSIDDGARWRKIPAQGSFVVYASQIKFYIETYVTGVHIAIQSPTLHLSMSRTTHGTTYSNNITLTQDVSDVSVT